MSEPVPTYDGDEKEFQVQTIIGKLLLSATRGSGAITLCGIDSPYTVDAEILRDAINGLCRAACRDSVRTYDALGRETSRHTDAVGTTVCKASTEKHQ